MHQRKEKQGFNHEDTRMKKNYTNKNLKNIDAPAEGKASI